MSTEMHKFAFFCLTALLASLAGVVHVHAAEKPNIVFLFTDDQAPWALGAAGHPLLKTPHMDRLAKEGAYLPNSFTVTPVCSPSRASLMTSRYGSELGIPDWIHPKKEPELGLDPATVTWPEVLQAARYKTGLVGKWHLGLPDKFHPTKTGFDYFMGFRSGGNSPVDPTLEIDGVNKKFKGLTPDILTTHALKFIDANKSDPFLLCVHYRAPHARWLPVAEEDWAPYRDADPALPHPDYPGIDGPRVKKMTREYMASVASVDRNIGRILKKLDDTGLAQQTIVIFSSDHGYNMGHNGIWHKGNGHWVVKSPPAAHPNIPRGQRPNMYDLSIRVPTIVRWPNVTKPGSVIKQTVSNLDWYPTLVSMGGAKLPEGETIRGRDLSAVLAGKAPADWDNNFYAEYSTVHQSRTHMRMYRTPEWKLVRDFLNEGRDELYDLTKDPQERNNLIGSDSPEVKAVIAKLHEAIVKHMKENGDAVLKGK